MGHLIFKDIFIIFIVSIPVVIITHRLKLPAIIGFIATGAIIGPDGLGWITHKNQIDILAELGVALLLFSVGLEFSFDHFKKMKRQGILIGLSQILLTILTGILIGYTLGWSTNRSLFFGCIMALSSTAIVMSSLTSRRSIESLPGRLSTIVLILQDLAFIPILILLQLFGSDQASNNSWQAPLVQSLKSLFIIIFIFLIIHYMVRHVLREIMRPTQSRELFIITVVSIALGTSWLTHHLGFSFALGAFLGGMLIGETDYNYQALAEISPFRHCFNALFFVSIGMLVNFSFIKDHLLIVSLLVVLIPLLKFMITTLSVSMAGFPLRVALVVGIFLGQIGEFSFLLAYMGEKNGIIAPLFYQLIVATSVMTMILTPLLIYNAHRAANTIAQLPFLRQLSRKHEDMAIQNQAESIKDHVIICGFGPLGRAFGKILKEHHIPYVILDINPETIENSKLKEANVFFGDGTSEEILFRSGIERARLLAITIPDFLNSAAIIQHARKLNNDIRIITRSKYRSEVEKLYDAGADIVISEELESGIEMSRYGLQEMGISKDKVEMYLNQIREFGSADFF